MRNTRLPALDGLRGVAVAGVVAFHTGASWAKGGYLGVSLFFTLSGFLIGGLLIREFDGSGHISLGGFWTRRFRRLWPAATMTVAAVFLLNALGGQFDVHTLAGDSLASLANVANWHYLIQGTSYQDLFEAPSPLLHFWSLAIEEQFYIVFPLVMAFCLRRGRRVAWGVVAALYGLSVVDQLTASSPDRAYLATGTRAGEILIGVMVALWFRRRDAAEPRPVPAWLVVIAPLVGVATLVAWTTVPKGTSAWENGGFVVVGVASCVLILGTIAPRGVLNRLLGVGVLAWLGTRSFAIYLFHWPIFVMWAPGADGRVTPIEWLPRLVLVGLLAEASYRVVEMPIRRTHLLARGWWTIVATTTTVLIAVMALVLAVSDPPVDRFELSADPPAFVPPTAPRRPSNPRRRPRLRPEPTVRWPTPWRPSRRRRPHRRASPSYGDSTARAAADGLVEWSENTGLAWVYDLSKPSCPISEYARFRQSPNEPTQPATEACEWRGRFEGWLSDFDPDVVVVMGGTSEIVDFETPELGRTNILSPDGYDFVRNELTTLAGEIRAGSADTQVVVTTAPYNDWLLCLSPCLTHQTVRFDRYNELVAELVADGTFDAALPYADHINGMDLEPTDPFRPDGVHLSPNGSRRDAEQWLGPAVLETLSAREGA